MADFFRLPGSLVFLSRSMNPPLSTDDSTVGVSVMGHCSMSVLVSCYSIGLSKLSEFPNPHTWYTVSFDRLLTFVFLSL